jgi:hypothetical protein
MTVGIVKATMEVWWKRRECREKVFDNVRGSIGWFLFVIERKFFCLVDTHGQRRTQ